MWAFTYPTSVEWLQSFSLVAKSISIYAVSATTLPVVAYEPWPDGTAAQQRIPRRSAKIPPNIATVVVIIVRIVETAWLDRPELAR